ncbi:hypothetical protein AMTRI_Chr01g136870 [Amborella trichopoda]
MPPTTHKEPFRDRGHDVSLELTCAEPDGATPFPAIVCRGPPKVSSELPVLRAEMPPALTARYLTTQTLSFSEPTFPLPPPRRKQKLPCKSSSFLSVGLFAFLASVYSCCSVVAFNLLL